MPSMIMRPPAAAQYLGVSLSYLNKRRCYGGGPRYSKCGKLVIYDQPDLDVWLAEHKRSSTSDSRQGQRAER